MNLVFNLGILVLVAVNVSFIGAAASQNPTSTPVPVPRQAETTTSTLQSSTTQPTQAPVTQPQPLATTCNLKKSSAKEKMLQNEISKFMNQQYSWEDDDHLYYFGVCTKAQHADQSDMGFIQINKKQNKTFVLGKLNDVDLEGSKTWIRLTYKEGDKYANACNRNKRSAVVMFLCDTEITEDKFEMIEENNERDNDCAYVFQLTSPKMCPENATKCAQASSSSGLGFFSSLLIIGSVFVVLYFLIGFLYLRIVHQARGIDQIPNLEFWKTIGGKTSEGVKYVLRCGRKPAEVHSYENINDGPSDDENMLNM